MLCDLAELAAIDAESIGWQPLGDGAYLHLGKPEEKDGNNRGQTTVYLGFDPCPSASEQLRHP